MSDYAKLVEDLKRGFGHWYVEDWSRLVSMYADAAAAIEELQDKVFELEEELNDVDIAADDNARQVEALQAEVDTLKRTDSKRCQECLYLGQPVGEQLIPKRGKWIIDGAFTYNLRELNGKAYEPVYRCSCCNRQTESYVRLDEPKMPEDADFPEYCPHCGARMEVQDETEIQG